MAWLFSYGSNNPEQLSARIGHELDEMRPVWLKGYQRVFRGYSRGWSGGVASLEPRRGATTFGYIAKVDRDDLELVDRYEGVAVGMYYREKVTVHTPDGPVKAIAYIATSDDFHPPSRAYLASIVKTIGAFWSGEDGPVKISDIPIR
jgi:hypothetical protein